MNDYYKKFLLELKNRNYAWNTIKIYSKSIKLFFDFTRENEQLSPEDRIRDFLASFTKSNEQRRIAYMAIKLLYELVIMKKCPYQLSKIRSVKRIPEVLSKTEILTILKQIRNKKHYLMIAMLYGSGLRISELIRLKIADLDFEYQKLRVRKSKNNKDRITVLSESLIDELKKIILGRKVNDAIFITNLKKNYKTRTIQKIFSLALKESKIQKRATCHTLRHSFATHLIESGTSITLIKDLLGHKSIKTTMIYLHVSHIIKNSVISPL